MKQWLHVLLMLMLATTACAQQPKVALIGCRGTDQTKALIDLVTAELTEKGVTLVERQQIDAVLKEQGLQAVGATREQAVTLGALLSADVIATLEENLQPNPHDEAFSVAGIHVVVYETDSSIKRRYVCSATR